MGKRLNSKASPSGEENKEDSLIQGLCILARIITKSYLNASRTEGDRYKSIDAEEKRSEPNENLH